MISIQQPCVVLSNSNMACKSPAIEFEGKEPDLEPAKGLVYGFHMDNVTGVQNLSNQKGYSRFFLYPNPVYEPFDEEIKYYKSDYLTINVSFFKSSKKHNSIVLILFHRDTIWTALVKKPT